VDDAAEGASWHLRTCLKAQTGSRDPACISVCRGAYGKQLGEGLFEFRLRHDAGEILRSLGKPARDEPQRERILLRVFCHAHGDRLILLLGGYDKGADPSKHRQQREIAEARRRLVDFRKRA
jgi:hypothetical protein